MEVAISSKNFVYVYQAAQPIIQYNCILTCTFVNMSNIIIHVNLFREN